MNSSQTIVTVNECGANSAMTLNEILEDSFELEELVENLTTVFVPSNDEESELQYLANAYLDAQEELERALRSHGVEL